MIRTVILFTVFTVFFLNTNAAPLIDAHVASFKLEHGAQGTGNYKGKRDRHEKAGPQNEKKKNPANGYR